MKAIDRIGLATEEAALVLHVEGVISAAVTQGGLDPWAALAVVQALVLRHQEAAVGPAKLAILLDALASGYRGDAVDLEAEISERGGRN